MENTGGRPPPPPVTLVANHHAGGNVGTLVRACAAFGVEELLLVGHERFATHGQGAEADSPLKTIVVVVGGYGFLLLLLL